MPLPSESHPLEDPNSSSIHSFVPPDLTGRITQLDNQYCAAGSFGDVYRCQYRSECDPGAVKEVAVKTFRFEFTVEEGGVDGRSNRMIRRELGIWRRLSHPNIVPFLGTVSGFGRLGNASLVSSWMPNGTLHDFLLKYNDRLTVAHRLQFLLGIANGLQYLHSLSTVHGDLTCNNVLLDEQHNARLTDFGYASLVGEIPDALVYLQASTLRPGAVRWAAPEYFFSNPEEMRHCTTKSDIYSFGNISLQVLSGELPWSEFRRDVVIVLHLAKGHKPRRPQSHPIDDQHWDFIEHCWLPVQERPSAEHLVSCVLEFLRSHPDPQSFCGLLVSLEKIIPKFTLSGPLSSPPNNEQFSPDIPLEDSYTFENSHLMAPNCQHDQPPTVGGFSPPRTVQYPPRLTPDNISSTLPPLGDRGSEPTSKAGRFQSFLETYNRNGSAANPDVSVTDIAFPRRPPPTHSKSGAASPPFLNTSIGQDPFLSSSSQQHYIHHHHSWGTTASRGDSAAASGSSDEKGGIWGSLFSRLGSPSQKRRPLAFGAPISPQCQFAPASNGHTFMRNQSDPLHPSRKARYHNVLEGSGPDDSTPMVSPPQQLRQQIPSDVPALQLSSNCQPLHRIMQICSSSPTGLSASGFLGTFADYDFLPDARADAPHLQPSIALTRDTTSSTQSTAFLSNSPVPPPANEPYRDAPNFNHTSGNNVLTCLVPGDPVRSIRGHSLTASGPRGGGDGTWSALSSNRPSPYPRLLASPLDGHEDLPDVALTGQQSPFLCPDPPQPNNGGRRRKEVANFLCPVPGCGSKFTRIFNLKDHMKSHDKERPFQCKWPGCDKSFFRQHDCRRHEQLHSKHCPVTCDGCNKAFARMDALNRHLRSEGGAECQRILDAAKDLEILPVTKVEEKGWPGMSVIV